MEIYTFDKSLQERLVELTEILSSRGEIVPASQIQAEWCYHVELVIEPVGWQALWKIPRLVCEDFQIHYPTIVVVEVEQVDFADLSALVKITAVQDEIHLPEKYDVPLVELYPTHSQANNVLDMVGTSNCIDQLRFFYNYLWMPWDLDDDDSADWVSVHLETRIRLFFDMKRGVVSKETSDVIRSLIREGREVQQKISRLEDTISEEEESHEVVDGGTACQLMKLHFRLQQIKREMEVLENPAMREILVKNRTTSLINEKIQRSESKERCMEGYFVWLGGTLEEMKEAINKVQVYLPAELYFKISGSLHETLHACDSGDTVVVAEGTHYIKSAGNLEEGGTIRGVHNVERTILSVKDSETAPSLLDFSGNEVLLEGITVDAGDLRAVVIVRAGITKIVNCKICASNQSIVKLGVVVLPNAKLIIENTVFDGLGTALVIYSNGEVLMNNCSFKNCAEGIQLYDNVKLTARNCYLSHFKEYAMRLETQKYLRGSDNKCGGKELLVGVSEVSLDECKFEGNGKGDIILKHGKTFALTKQDGTANMET
ncbi:PREDICTED: SHC SH2 domain-binding protein 1 [Dufourea novaeangliae]|uniref:SHC SH2 domain-binding protein 1 like protein B n=1 Tax=Dufourea novaeangliae TaxID=178035 RepID=A0A154P6V9_DUFNO|nr:PREDICTED: SHC SH2 domain-binding protein 1 [Dufourea novaeangliae]XP_015428395.1 PREDICTED: SHC SH2 domain-binding protein 1 [Dufourea novaeangliae]KZC06928.1 SHC SH2 domain-binding protein 1 like protein B [Dufourea novaeangliae]